MKYVNRKAEWVRWIVAIVMLLVLCGCGADKLDVVCVPTEQEAIAIGKVICQKTYPEFDYDQYSWKCIYDENEEVWWVFCSSGDMVLGGGLPEIHIKKSNAEVTFISLMA